MKCLHNRWQTHWDIVNLLSIRFWHRRCVVHACKHLHFVGVRGRCIYSSSEWWECERRRARAKKLAPNKNKMQKTRETEDNQKINKIHASTSNIVLQCNGAHNTSFSRSYTKYNSMWQIFILRGHPRIHIRKWVCARALCAHAPPSTIISATFYSFDIYTPYFHILSFPRSVKYDGMNKQHRNVRNDWKERRGTINARRVLLSQYFIQINIVLRKIYKKPRTECETGALNAATLVRVSSRCCCFEMWFTPRSVTRHITIEWALCENCTPRRSKYCKVCLVCVFDPGCLRWWWWAQSGNERAKKNLVQFSYFVGGKSSAKIYGSEAFRYNALLKHRLDMATQTENAAFAFPDGVKWFYLRLCENCSDGSSTSCIWSH